MPTSDRGFASLTKEQRSAIARLGGLAAHKAGTAHEWTHAEAKAAGKLGGKKGQPKKKAVAAIVATLLVLCARPVAAQTATPASKLAWDEPGQTATVAQAAGYTLYLDAATTGMALVNVACTAPTTGPVACAAAFPAMTPGTHALTITQTIGGVESAKSSALSVTLVVVVTPANIRIIP